MLIKCQKNAKRGPKMQILGYFKFFFLVHFLLILNQTNKIQNLKKIVFENLKNWSKNADFSLFFGIK